MSSITESLNKLQTIAAENYKILAALNESFYSNKTNINISVGGSNFNIPSFLSLQDQISGLAANFKNLVSAPQTGTAAFDFNGNTQSIIMEGFKNSPSQISNITRPTTFSTVKNNILKDLTIPNVFVTFDVNSIPDSINDINVKKVVLMSPKIIEDVKAIAQDGRVTWGDFTKIKYNYTSNDYNEYDKLYNLPIKKNDKHGSYGITTITEHHLDANFDERYTLTLDSQLTYFYDNGTMEARLNIGDILITANDQAKFIIENINTGDNTIIVRVLSGFSELTTLSESTTLNNNTLKFYSVANYDSFKKVQVNLEENRYILLFLSPVNKSINIGAQWSDGIFLDTHELRYDMNSDMSFLEYYKANVENVGDILSDLSIYFDSTFNNISPSSFNILGSYQPIINTDDIIVKCINEHLGDDPSLQSIRRLNTQKVELQNELHALQTKISTISTTLSTTNFVNSTMSVRQSYANQLEDLNAQRNNYMQNISNLVKEINNIAQNTVIPIDAFKYRVLGGINTNIMEDVLKNLLINDSVIQDLRIIKINVEYRYKNPNKKTTNATTIGDTYLYSDWNKLDTSIRQKTASLGTNNIVIEYAPIENSNDSAKFNSLSIPITQGETVDIKIQVQYNLGYPFMSFTSAWSVVENIGFPQDMVVNIGAYDIIKANEKDEQETFVNNTLIQTGVLAHIDDRVVDQDLTYFHHPEKISSGFFTEDARRIISLKDKLFDITNTLTGLEAEVSAAINNNLVVTVSDDIHNITIVPFEKNQIFTAKSFDDLVGGLETTDPTYRTTLINITISNNGKSPIKLYSMYFGSLTSSLTTTYRSSRWATETNILQYFNGTKGTSTPGPVLLIGGRSEAQNQNQFIYFRTRTPNSSIDTMDITYDTNADITATEAGIIPSFEFLANIQNEKTLPGSYTQINPGSGISIPVRVRIGKSVAGDTKKLIAFDVWYSMFQEPITYIFQVQCSKSNTILQRLTNSQQYNVYNPIIMK